MFQFPGGEHHQQQQHVGHGYLQTLLRQEPGQFQGLQENFLQAGREQPRLQYPAMQGEVDKTGQEEERPRMHNGKKVNI